MLPARICGLKSSIGQIYFLPKRDFARKKLNAIPSGRPKPVQDLNVDISNKIHNAHLFNVILTLDPFAAEAVASPCLNKRKLISLIWNSIHLEMIKEHVGGTFKEQHDMYWLFQLLTPDPKWRQVIGAHTYMREGENLNVSGRDAYLSCLCQWGGEGFMYPKCIFHSNVNVSQKLIRPIVILTQIYERATYEVAVSKFAIRSLHLTSLSVVEFMLV